MHQAWTDRHHIPDWIDGTVSSTAPSSTTDGAWTDRLILEEASVFKAGV